MTRHELEMKFLEVLLGNREIYIEEEFDRDLTSRVHKMIRGLNAQGDGEIKVYLNSGGGSVISGLNLYDAIKTSKAPIIGIVFSEANSMAIVALQACHRRLAMEHSSFYFHLIKLRLSKEWNEFREEAKKELEKIEKDQEEIWKIFAQRGIDIEKIKKLCEEKKIISAQEALGLNLIDEILK